MNVIERIVREDIGIKLYRDAAYNPNPCCRGIDMQDAIEQDKDDLTELLRLAKLGQAALEDMENYCDYGFASRSCLSDQDCSFKNFCKLREEG